MAEWLLRPKGIPGTEKYPQFGEILLRPEKPFHSVTRYRVLLIMR